MAYDVAALPPEERVIVDVLGDTPRHVDDLHADLPLGVAQANAALLMLELKGLVRRLPGNRYCKL